MGGAGSRLLMVRNLLDSGKLCVTEDFVSKYPSCTPPGGSILFQYSEPRDVHLTFEILGKDDSTVIKRVRLHTQNSISWIAKSDKVVQMKPGSSDDQEDSKGFQAYWNDVNSDGDGASRRKREADDVNNWMRQNSKPLGLKIEQELLRIENGSASDAFSRITQSADVIAGSVSNQLVRHVIPPQALVLAL